ncbi:MAG: glutamate--cysteine ligase [Burkholderiales bacterium]|nr:MAG: glutamate--cysteine ligase [Burkholderiales bacterium]
MGAATVEERLQRLSPEQLRGIRRGVEREALRARPDGWLALTPHPPALGSALMHPHITTDFCESQLELITAVHGSIASCLAELTQVHQFVVRCLGNELLWATSMPCSLPTDETIPVARFGTSNVGRAKSVYRTGLGHRYGKRMQTISGVHYNWSMPGLDNDAYFGLIRNFRRHAFLLLYLFGGSPAVSASFVAGRVHALQPLSEQTLGLPHATTLRMGRLGYQSDAQAALAVSYNSLDSYAGSLHTALTRPHPPYEAFGIRNPGGEYNQLSTSLLQIENEFYGTIRPKRTIRSGERPLHALRERGVEYVEVRCLDLDPYAPIGVSATTLAFVDLFLLHCLLEDSPPDNALELAALARNQERTAAQGREPGLMLERECGGVVSLVDWGRELLEALGPIAQALDAVNSDGLHGQALRAARAALDDPSRLPSARMLDAMTRDFGNAFNPFGRAQSVSARAALMALPWGTDTQARFAALAAASIEEQAALEAREVLDFEQYRVQYLSPEGLMPAAG